MKVNVYSLDGKAAAKLDLPKVFEEEVRDDIIRRAVLAAQSAKYQRHGVDWFAGKRTSAFSWGPGHGVSRVPRVKGSGYPAGGRAAIVPQAVGGRSAHPPKPEREPMEKINSSERRRAIASAIAATGIKELVAKRGHIIDKVPQIPLILTDELEDIKKAKEFRNVLATFGLLDDVIRAKEKRIRAGKGKRRGRKYGRKKSALIVVSKGSGIKLGARNYQGIDIVRAENVGAEDLAPGAHCGRLAVYTESAIKKIGERFH